MRRIVLSVVGSLLIFVAVPRIGAIPISAAVQQESKQEAKTFTGTVIKNGDNFILSDAVNKISYTLDDARKASEFEGQKVRVTGTVDLASNTLHVETILAVA